MTRAELVKFLEETYEPEEQLLWQTISYDDVENGIEEATPELWGRFLKYLEAHNWVAEQFSENSFQGFYDFIEEHA